MKTIWGTIILALCMVGCSPDEHGGPETPEKPPVVNPPEPPEPPEPPSTGVILLADGTTDTYSLISSKGFSPAEAPDNYPSNHPGIKHITQIMDGDLDKWVFAFDIHLQDKDRDQTQITDRQRNEIKADDHSPDNLKGIEGEKVVYRWKFRLPEGMKATSSFTHIHQLKGVGGNDIGMPLITLTVRKKSNGNQIELIYVPPKEDPGGQGNDYLATVPFADFEGEWVEATETVTYGYDTNYSMSITRIRDGKRLLFYSGKRDMWRTGATMIRPKWGIYRSIGDNGNKKTELRDERLLFADFEVEEPADE